MSARILIALGVLGCVLGGTAAEAADCGLSASSVRFGNYNVFVPAPTDSTGAVVYRCNGSAKSVVIALTRGQSGTFPRELQKGTESLEYNLFKDASRTTVWGDGTAGTQLFYAGDPPNHTDVTVPIFGRIPPGQDIASGSYSDNVTVMMLF